MLRNLKILSLSTPLPSMKTGPWILGLPIVLLVINQLLSLAKFETTTIVLAPFSQNLSFVLIITVVSHAMTAILSVNVKMVFRL